MSSRTVTFFSWSSMLVAAVVCAAPVRAQITCPERPIVEEEAKSQASAWFRRGTRLFESGQYRKALATFICTQRIMPNQLTQYLIGRSAEGAGMYRVALSVYRKLVARPPESVTVEEIKKRAAAVEKKIKAATRTVPGLAPRDPSGKPEKPDQPEAASREPTAGSKGRAVKERVDVASIKKAAWAITAVAVAVTAAGVAMGVLLAVDKKKIEDAPDGAPWYPSLDERQRRMKAANISMGVCLGVGLASAVTGIVLFVVKGKKEKEAAAEMGLVPVKGGTVASVGGRF